MGEEGEEDFGGGAFAEPGGAGVGWIEGVGG